MDRVAILSDIHGNLQALESVYQDILKKAVDGLVFLGDLIDYGQQSNEVVRFIRDDVKIPVVCNIWGNHERAILLSDFSCFSSERGIESAKYTQSCLDEDVKDYLFSCMDESGESTFPLENARVLAIHGSREDAFWKSIEQGNVRGNYDQYDIVLSGHSHLSHFFSLYYDCDNPRYRNKKRVAFINPGSVGQPRNHNPNAQYAIMDISSGTVDLRCVVYDIKKAQSYFADEKINGFYRDRLAYGI